MKRTTITLTILLTALTSFGQTWESVGNSLPDNVYDLQKFDNKLYIGGRVGVKFWNDTIWTNLPHPFGIAFPLSLAVYDDTLYVGGDFPYSGSISHVYKYNGSSWVQVGGAFDASDWSSTKRLLTFNGQLISGGHYTSINGSTIYNIASWDGATWSSLGNGLNGGVWHLAEHNGQLLASGSFSASGSDTTIKRIAKWNGTNWSSLDTTLSINSAGPMISFDSLLFIGEIWDTINGIPMKGIASWDGTTFTSRGNNLIHSVTNFWTFNNELYLCGDIYTLNPNNYSRVVLKWNGFYWQQVGSNFNQTIWTIGDFNNQLFCGGQYTSPTSYIARLNTTTGISELDEQVTFEFYPNPATDKIIFSTSKKGTLTITNQLGQLVDGVSITDNQTQISTDNLSSGIYFLTFQTERNIVIRKLIVNQ